MERKQWLGFIVCLGFGRQNTATRQGYSSGGQISNSAMVRCSARSRIWSTFTHWRFWECIRMLPVYICLKESAHLIYSRAKVASLEKITRTRLEPQAVFGGATCADFIWQEIHIKVLAAHAWTESMTERHWLQKSAHSWTAWVANRVSIMKHYSNLSSLTWRHCPGFFNPADLPRQGGKMSSRMEQWRLHIESMWTAHKRKWLKSWWSSVRNGCETCHHFDGKPCDEMTLTKILMSTHENLMRFSWENENCQRFSWDSHELFTKSHENLTRSSFSRENWNVFSWEFLAFMSFSWDFSWVSHEILVSLFFTWKLERFLMRISWECHEILMSIFGRFLMKTLNMEIDACTEFSWDSHEAEIFSRDSHESAVVSWASHEILMRFSRDSH